MLKCALTHHQKHDTFNMWMSRIGALCAAIVASSSFSYHAYTEDNKSNKMKVYRRSEVKKHINASDGIWVTYKNGVYDVTNFVSNHPGGTHRIMLAAGKDLSELWKDPQYQLHFRSPLAMELLEEMRIGDLHSSDIVEVDMAKLEKPPLKYPTNKVYDCIVIGSGLSGLQCAQKLTSEHKISPENVLVLEALDYVGGRVHQVTDFIKGVNIDVGAEFLHGSNTLLTKFAEENNEPVSELFCWAHGDGGPLPKDVNGGFGLYYFDDKKGKGKRLLRYDASDSDFVRMNNVLWDLAEIDEEKFSDNDSLDDYLRRMNFSDEMIKMAAGGFANTLCTNIKDLSLKQVIRWSKGWHDPTEEEERDYMLLNTFKCVVDKLKSNLQIETNSPVTFIQYPREASQDVGLVQLQTAHGHTYYAKTIVVTSSPHVLKSGVMQFQPPLSPDIVEALNTVNMHSIVKVFLKFSQPVWPKNLHGMIFTSDDMLLPEIWFKDVSSTADADEPAKAYAIGFTTAEYAAKLQQMPKEEVMKSCVQQLETVFSMLKKEHMAADPSSKDTQNPSDLPRASEAYLGGMFWDWNPVHYPFIGGGYCSPKAKTATHKIAILSKPYGSHVFFAGEATNMPGATAHAALESGIRAADNVTISLASNNVKSNK